MYSTISQLPLSWSPPVSSHCSSDAIATARDLFNSRLEIKWFFHVKITSIFKNITAICFLRFVQLGLQRLSISADGPISGRRFRLLKLESPVRMFRCRDLNSIKSQYMELKTRWIYSLDCGFWAQHLNNNCSINK